MTTSSLHSPCTAAAPRRPGVLARLVAIVMAPSLRDLDHALLNDVGAPEVLRAQAELREAWRHWLPPDGGFLAL